MATNNVEKTPMSTGYKIVFMFAIFVLLVNISATIISIGGKSSSSSSISILLWIYIIWKMWSRDNKALVSIFNAFFWLSLIGSILGVLIIAWAGGISYATTSLLILLCVIGVATIFLMRFLREFFKKELNKQDVAIDKP